MGMQQLTQLLMLAHSMVTMDMDTISAIAIMDTMVTHIMDTTMVTTMARGLLMPSQLPMLTMLMLAMVVEPMDTLPMATIHLVIMVTMVTLIVTMHIIINLL